jgi:hypothetical protein
MTALGKARVIGLESTEIRRLRKDKSHPVATALRAVKEGGKLGT